MESFEVIGTAISDWVVDAAAAAKDSISVNLASEQLLSTFADLCDLSGAAGGIFRLASRAIPSPTAEQRIAVELHKAFVTSLDRELQRARGLVTVHSWRRYVQENLRQVAVRRLKAQFTWLSILGRGGQRPGRSWPIVSDLADLGRHWLLGAGSVDRGITLEIQQFADTARGRIHDSLAEAMDRLLVDQRISMALAEARSRLDRDTLTLLATELVGLRRYRLFAEVCQENIYIPPMLRFVDSKDISDNSGWREGKRIAEAGDEQLFHIIRDEHPRIIVIEGEMGSGKSCLMRALGSRLAEAYLQDRKLVPVYVRWRDIYDKADLLRAIGEQLSWDFGLPIPNLSVEEGIVYLIDGFDEMNSHQEGYVSACFDSIAQIARHNCSVVLAMRSTVVTPGLRQLWKNRSAIAVEVQPFDNRSIDAWAEKWQLETGAREVTGDRLRKLCHYGGEKEIAQNPLLLYMLAKYVEPTSRGAKQDAQPMTRTQIFRLFVDETIKGKVQNSSEEFPIPISDSYRLLLQEIARVASWPHFSPRCPTRIIREMTREAEILEDLHFSDIRTAFVLHFFEPFDLAANEFEFQPEGFRQYLLAEWCVRTQIEALRDERHPVTRLSRNRRAAVNALAQFPLMGEERSLLAEIFEELGRLSLASQDLSTDQLSDRLRTFGVEQEKGKAFRDLIADLYERLLAEVQSPPFENWDDERVGIPVGQEVPREFSALRFMLNYWDQCLIGLFGLYRGLGRSTAGDEPFGRDPVALARFIRLWQAVRGFAWRSDLNLAGIRLPRVDLRHVVLSEANLSNCNLDGANLERSILQRVNLRYASAEHANFAGAELSNSELVEATLFGANVSGASLRGAKLMHLKAQKAKFDNADLEGADLTEARFDRSSLVSTNFVECQMDGCSIENAQANFARFNGAQLAKAAIKGSDFTGANFSRAVLRLADLNSATLVRAVMNEAVFTQANLSNTSGMGASLVGCNLSMADLRNADFRNADLTSANLSGASLNGTHLTGSKLDGAIVTPAQLQNARFD